MKRKTNLFYTTGYDSKFITFSNYTEAMTGNFLSTNTKLFPSRFLALNIENLNKESKRHIIKYLALYYESKLAACRDELENNNKLSEDEILPLNYLLEALYSIEEITNDYIVLTNGMKISDDEPNIEYIDDSSNLASSDDSSSSSSSSSSSDDSSSSSSSSSSSDDSSSSASSDYSSSSSSSSSSSDDSSSSSSSSSDDSSSSSEDESIRGVDFIMKITINPDIDRAGLNAIGNAFRRFCEALISEAQSLSTNYQFDTQTPNNMLAVMQNANFDFSSPNNILKAKMSEQLFTMFADNWIPFSQYTQGFGQKQLTFVLQAYDEERDEYRDISNRYPTITNIDLTDLPEIEVEDDSSSSSSSSFSSDDLSSSTSSDDSQYIRGIDTNIKITSDYDWDVPADEEYDNELISGFNDLCNYMLNYINSISSPYQFDRQSINNMLTAMQNRNYNLRNADQIVHIKMSEDVAEEFAREWDWYSKKYTHGQSEFTFKLFIYDSTYYHDYVELEDHIRDDNTIDIDLEDILPIFNNDDEIMSMVVTNFTDHMSDIGNDQRAIDEYINDAINSSNPVNTHSCDIYKYYGDKFEIDGNEYCIWYFYNYSDYNYLNNHYPWAILTKTDDYNVLYDFSLESGFDINVDNLGKSSDWVYAMISDDHQIYRNSSDVQHDQYYLVKLNVKDASESSSSDSSTSSSSDSSTSSSSSSSDITPVTCRVNINNLYDSYGIISCDASEDDRFEVEYGTQITFTVTVNKGTTLGRFMINNEEKQLDSNKQYTHIITEDIIVIMQAPISNTKYSFTNLSSSQLSKMGYIECSYIQNDIITPIVGSNSIRLPENTIIDLYAHFANDTGVYGVYLNNALIELSKNTYSFNLNCNTIVEIRAIDGRPRLMGANPNLSTDPGNPTNIDTNSNFDVDPSQPINSNPNINDITIIGGEITNNEEYVTSEYSDYENGSDISSYEETIEELEDIDKLLVPNFNTELISLNYIGDVTEQNYNGTFTDTICIIDLNDYRVPTIITQSSEIYDDKNIKIDIPKSIKNDQECIYGWHNEILETYKDYVSIYDVRNRTSVQYRLNSYIQKLEISGNVTNNLEFNCIIPLYDLVNTNYTSNFSSIKELEEINLLPDTYRDENSIYKLYNLNIPLGMWFYTIQDNTDPNENKIKLYRDNETGFSQSWSLTISSQFKPFPYSQSMPNEICTNQDSSAFMTFAQVLANQNRLIDKINEYTYQFKYMDERLANIQSQLNNIGTLYNIDNIHKEMANYQNYMNENYNTFKDQIYSYINNLRWKVTE